MHFSDLKWNTLVVVVYKHETSKKDVYDYELTQILNANHAYPHAILKIINCCEYLIPDSIKQTMIVESFHKVIFSFNPENYRYEFFGIEVIDDNDPNQFLFLH